jgi:hypothetical protein
VSNRECVGYTPLISFAHSHHSHTKEKRTNYKAATVAYDRENQAAAQIILADTTGKYDGLPKMWAAAVLRNIPQKIGGYQIRQKIGQFEPPQKVEEVSQQLTLELAA